MLAYSSGLVLGLSLITCLGPQNVFLIRQGILGTHAILAALTCFLCDSVLVYASVAKLHEVLDDHLLLQQGLTWLGSLFLLLYGIKTLRQAGCQQAVAIVAAASTTRWRIIMMSLGFSLLNPHAIIDSLVIIGGGSSQFPQHRGAFFFGVITASFLWFFLLTFILRFFSKTFSQAWLWRRIEYSSGVLMILLGLQFAYNQF